jgi:DNA primase
MEGIFDVLAGGWEGWALGLFGSRLSECWMAWLQQTDTRPILWFDPDEGGDQGIREAVESLEGACVPHAVYRRPQHPKDLRYWDPELPGVRQELYGIAEGLLCSK